jgi:uncharacterized RDD family membrane protein YckC
MNLHNTNPYASPAIPSEPLPRPAPSAQAELATLWQRFAGSMIDGIVALPFALAFGFGLFIGMERTGLPADSLEYQITTALIGLVIGGGFYFAIHGYLLATRGQTIGKYFMRTQIVSDEGKLLPLPTMILWRYLPLMIISQVPFVGAIVGLANVLAIFRASRKCFHDDIAGTKVIQIVPSSSEARLFFFGGS